MTSQILSFLHPSSRRSVVCAALLTLPLPRAGCAGTSTLASADIPFSFSTAQKTLPADRYIFAMVTPHVYALRQVDGSTVQFMSVQNGEIPKNKNASLVHFHRYGGSYFLEGAWFAAAGTGFQSYPGKAEKEARTRLAASEQKSEPAGTEVALNLGPNQKCAARQARGITSYSAVVSSRVNGGIGVWARLKRYLSGECI